jgi:hypothetical protein
LRDPVAEAIQHAVFEQHGRGAEPDGERVALQMVSLRPSSQT